MRINSLNAFSNIYKSGAHTNDFEVFGCVSMQDPATAALEAERCVKELGFVGILVNGYCNIGRVPDVQYFDEMQCEPSCVKPHELDLPLYCTCARAYPPCIRCECSRSTSS